jgi:hypothetical protein
MDRFDCIISYVTMSYNATNEVCTLDMINAEESKKFVTEKNVYRVNVQGLCSCAYSLLWSGCCVFQHTIIYVLDEPHALL